MHKNLVIAISGTSAVFLGGAFVITMAGSQFFATNDFCSLIHLPNNRLIIEPIDWIAGVSCAYIMAFSRCSKIYHDTYKKLTANNNNKKELSYCESYSLPTHILNVLGTMSGGVRGILVGFLGSLTLMHAIRIYQLHPIYAVAIFVGISNTITYASYMVEQANKNTELAIRSFSSASVQETENNSSRTARYTKIISAIVITLIALIGTFSYFNYISYNAFIQMPYLNQINHESAYYTVIINTVLTVIVGGLAKGLQFYRYLNDKEEENAEQLAKITSPKIKSHFFVGAIYIFFYTISLSSGVIKTLNFPLSYAIPTTIIIVLFSGLLEYIFSVRIMINEERKRIYATQTERTPLLLEAGQNQTVSLARSIQFFPVARTNEQQKEELPITEIASTSSSPQEEGSTNQLSKMCTIV